MFLAVTATFSNAQETRKRIIVIDSGVKFSLAPHLKKYECSREIDLSDAGTAEVEKYRTHGTGMTDIITTKVDPTKYCFQSIRYSRGDSKTNQEHLLQALKIATLLRAFIINLSLSGFGSDKEEYKLIKQLVDQGKIVVVAAGNDGRNLDKSCWYYPVCYDLSIIRVGAREDSGTRASSSNYGNIVNRWALNHFKAEYDHIYGTSPAAAYMTNFIVLKDQHASLFGNNAGN